ncbi:MAG: LPS export ABC transporter periplasmic protein LptC [Gammaproteobacteria bacterium]
MLGWFKRQGWGVLGWLAALGLLALLTQWLLYISAPPDDRRAALRHVPDATMDDFVATGMGVDGRPEHRLRAQRMLHYPDDGSTEFIRPLLTVFQENAPPWQVRAERGLLAKDRDSVWLQDAVRIENPDAAPHLRWRLDTRDLHVKVDEEYAETARPVTIAGETSVTHAVGMKVFLKEGRVQLLAKVKGTYEVNTGQKPKNSLPNAPQP